MVSARFDFPSSPDENRAIWQDLNHYDSVATELQHAIETLDTDIDHLSRQEADGSLHGVYAEFGFWIPVSAAELATSRQGLEVLILDVRELLKALEAAAEMPAPVVEARKKTWCSRLITWLLGAGV